MQIQLKEDVKCLKEKNYFEVNELWSRMKSNDRNPNPMIHVMWLIVKASIKGGQVGTFFWADSYFKFHA